MHGSGRKASGQFLLRTRLLLWTWVLLRTLMFLRTQASLRSCPLLRAWVLLPGCMLLLAAACSSSGKPRREQPPNIVLITIDDLGWADLGCYGSNYYETPNLDRLATQGMLFTNAYASAAICSPTRAALMTGKAPARTGITDWIRARFQGGDIPENKTYELTYTGRPGDSLLCPTNPLWMELDEVTIAEKLKEQGYTTAHIGKWHLGAEDWYPEKQGFDINIGGCDYGQPPSYFDPYESPKANGIYNLPPREEGEHLSTRLADEAAGFIIANQEGPFFLNMADYAVHTPIQGRPDLVEKYKNKPSVDGQDNPEYAALIESMDLLVGRIMSVLDSLGLASNTLLVFTSDNGGLASVTDNSPLRSGKGFPYEGGIRVPLIVRYPGKIPAGSRSDVPVISHDWFPTFCDIIGISPGKIAASPGRIDISSDRETEIDGLSLKSLLYEGAAPERETLYWHFPHYRQKNVVPYSIIRKEDWKLIKRYEGKTFELFNLAADPSETTDLSESQPEKVKELNIDLEGWLQTVGAAMPKPKSNPVR